MFHFNDDPTLNLQLILFDPETNVLRRTQNPDTISLMMDKSNDDVNVVPFLPMDVIIQMHFRSTGELFPRLVSTPQLSELAQIQPIRNRLYHDFYNRNAFQKLVERRIILAEYYGRKLIHQEAIDFFESICPEPTDFYYQMVVNFMFEKQTINFQAPNVLDKSIWTDIFLFDPKIAKTRRCMWHETIQEEQFLALCRHSNGEPIMDNTMMSVVDCSSAIREWKMVQNSKHRRQTPMYQSIQEYYANERKKVDQNAAITQLKQNVLDLKFEDIGQPAVMKMENDLKEEIISKLIKLQNLQGLKRCFDKLGQDKDLLNRRCLPLINEALKTNQQALRVKEFKDDETQVDFWEVEWSGNWSNEWVQTDEC